MNKRSTAALSLALIGVIGLGGCSSSTSGSSDAGAVKTKVCDSLSGVSASVGEFTTNAPGETVGQATDKLEALSAKLGEAKKSSTGLTSALLANLQGTVEAARKSLASANPETPVSEQKGFSNSQTKIKSVFDGINSKLGCA